MILLIVFKRSLIRKQNFPLRKNRFRVSVVSAIVGSGTLRVLKSVVKDGSTIARTNVNIRKEKKRIKIGQERVDPTLVTNLLLP